MQQLDCNYKRRMKGHHEALSPLRALHKEPMTLDQYSVTSSLRDDSACVYFHVPFCSKLCNFCNMRRQLGSPPEDYSALIITQLREFARHRDINKCKFNAIYFGGGTPSVLSPSSLDVILRELHKSLSIESGAEITLETSVSDLTDEHLDVLEVQGVNRISFGVQTFSNRGRRLLGRKGFMPEIIFRIEEILQQGFDNVSLDLIYNYPAQTMNELVCDLDVITDLNISGISFYPLMLHEGSVIQQRVDDRVLEPPQGVNGELLFFQKIYEHLQRHSFEVMELTKMVRPGRDRYQYIRTRYSGGSTLALGAGAGGKLGRFVYQNPLDISDYRAHAQKEIGDLPGLCKSIFEEKVYRIIGLVQMGTFPGENFWPDAEHWLNPLRQRLLDEGLLKKGMKGFFLSSKGLFWGNNIAREIAKSAREQYNPIKGVD